MTASPNSASGATQPVRNVEHLVARYPDLAEPELEELLHWYRREASAHDIATLAMNERLRDGYRRFRADHIDRLRPFDMIRALAFLGLSAAVIAGIVYLTL